MRLKKDNSKYRRDMMQKLHLFLENAPKIFPAIASILASFSIIVGVLTYIESSEAEKRKLSLDYVEQWENKGHSEQYFDVLKLAYEYQHQHVDTFVDEKRLGALKQKVGLAWLENSNESPLFNDNKLKVQKLISFFGKVETCMVADLCDQEVLTLFFEEPAFEFWQYYKGYAYAMRDKSFINYGQKAEDFCKRVVDARKYALCLDQLN